MYIYTNKTKEKIPRYTGIVKFENKTLELLWLTQIFNFPEVVFQLPDKTKNNYNNPTITCELHKTIGNRIIN